MLWISIAMLWISSGANENRIERRDLNKAEDDVNAGHRAIAVARRRFADGAGSLEPGWMGVSSSVSLFVRPFGQVVAVPYRPPVPFCVGAVAGSRSHPQGTLSPLGTDVGTTPPRLLAAGSVSALRNATSCFCSSSVNRSGFWTRKSSDARRADSVAASP